MEMLNIIQGSDYANQLLCAWLVVMAFWWALHMHPIHMLKHIQNLSKEKTFEKKTAFHPWVIILIFFNYHMLLKILMLSAHLYFIIKLVVWCQYGFIKFAFPISLNNLIILSTWYWNYVTPKHLFIFRVCNVVVLLVAVYIKHHKCVHSKYLFNLWHREKDASAF